MGVLSVIFNNPLPLDSEEKEHDCCGCINGICLSK